MIKENNSTNTNKSTLKLPFRGQGVQVGIIGGAGYTAGELIRILLHHPKVNIQFIHSNSQEGKLVSDIHQDLLGETFLSFSKEIKTDIDVIFLCMGHGKSKVFLEKTQLPNHIKIIDLSRDYRLKNEDNKFVYGLPELNKSKIQQSNYIANCGCFATAIQLALLPLANAQQLKNDIHVHAITGSTGAGQNPSSTTHFSWRNNNVSIYKPFTHQHLEEIHQSIQQLQNRFEQEINFLPVRGNFSRGIFASIYTKTDLEEKELIELYQKYYADEPFVFISPTNPSLKQVVNTNKCVLFVKKEGNKVFIISLIDNLIKGASGQAVQNMNLIFGLKETEGLGLKAMAF